MPLKISCFSNDLPTWQRRGRGLYWEAYEKSEFDPVQVKEVVTTRRRVKVNEELPMKEADDQFIYLLLDVESARS